MNRLEKFLGKPIKKTINGEEIDIYPLLFVDSDVLVRLGDSNPDIRTTALKELMTRSLKKSFPEATDEDIRNFDARFFVEFLNAVFEASGLMDKDRKKLEEMTAQLA